MIHPKKKNFGLTYLRFQNRASPPWPTVSESGECAWDESLELTRAFWLTYLPAWGNYTANLRLTH